MAEREAMGSCRGVLASYLPAALALLALAVLTSNGARLSDWIECGLLSVAAAVAVVAFRRTPTGVACSPVTVFVVAAAILLPPELAALFLVLPFSIDYLVRRAPWWVQLANVANYMCAILSGALVNRALVDALGGPAGRALAAAMAATVIVSTNVALVALFQSRRLGRSFGAAWLDRESLEGELLSAALGVTSAAVLRSAAWATPFVFASVIALPRAFSLPLLRRDALERTRELEREQIANERLRELDRLKREFVAVISHELGGPITSIGGYTQLVLEGDDALTDEQRYFIGVVERNAQRLRRLVEDLALMDEVEHELVVASAAVDLRSVVGDSVASAQPGAVAKQIELNFVAAGDCTVWGDAGRLGQVADNLISNAIKYTPVGGAIEVRLQPNADSVDLLVGDDGPGISVADQARLFDRFFRTGSALKSSTPGSGLGLSIVKAIVDKHQGSTAVTSEVGTGTTFRVSLPVSPQMEVDAISSGVMAGSGR